ADRVVAGHSLHLELRRLLDGRARSRAGGDAARRSRGSANGRRHGVADVPARHGAAACPGVERRLHHDDHQRSQGVRHRAGACARVDTGERERDRARDVAHVVRRRKRLRHRIRDRGVPVPARDPGARTEHSTVPEGGVAMATAAAPALEIPRPHDSIATRVIRWIAKAPIHLALAILGVLWLVPTFGLFITSILPQSELASNGWWKIFSKPSLATWSNYNALYHNHGLLTALKTTAYIAVGNTLLVVIIGALAGHALASLEFPGRDWLFVGIVALLVVPLQMALIPMFRLYDTLSLYDTILGIVLFHVAFGLPFAIFLLRNFFIGLPKDILESARIDGASELRIFLRLILPLGLPAIASLAIFQFLWTWNDLIVALTFGQNTQPITVWIFGQLREFGTSIDVIAPASFISLIIPLAVFFAFQRYFVQGLLAGSV